jgi:hypothetical protein
MARNRREQSDPRVIQDWIDEGRGKGRNGSYKPWLRIQDLGSRGKSQRLPSSVTGDRIVHVLSGFETEVFYLYEWGIDVIDIREQFPLLPLEETLEIAAALKVEHPCEPKSGRPIVMTTDFLITRKAENGEKHFARAFKQVEEIGTIREMEKFEIARQWHARRQEDWGLLTERDIPTDLVCNLEELRERRDLSHYGGVSDDTIAHIEEVLLPEIWKGERPLSNVALDCDIRLGITKGTSLTVVYHMLYLRRWVMDLTRPLQPNKPLILLNPKPKDSHDVLVQFTSAMA